MPWTEYDYDPDHADLDYDVGPHAHYVGRNEPYDDRPCDHGGPAAVSYSVRIGEWYAVHTH